MIKLNTPYTIENGKDQVSFTEGKKGSINGTYGDGTLSGTLEGNVLNATFHNKKANASGLMEITFTENGFTAKWKNGLEPGPMRGKWEGIIHESYHLKHNSNNEDLWNSIDLYQITDVYTVQDIHDKLHKIITELDSSLFEKFIKHLISFVNEHHECFWLLISLDSYIHEIAMKVEREEEDMESEIESDKLNEILNFIQQKCKPSMTSLVLEHLKVDFNKEFSIYFSGKPLNNGWNSNDWLWSKTEGGKLTTFPELIMEISGLKWSDDDEEFDDSWSWEKYHHYATTCLWMGLINYYQRISSDIDEAQSELAFCLWSVFDDAYEPMQGSGGNWDIVEFILRKILFIEIDDFNSDENPNDRQDLEQWKEYVWDMKKISKEAIYREFGNDFAPSRWK
jgi:hypothetical protein